MVMINKNTLIDAIAFGLDRIALFGTKEEFSSSTEMNIKIILSEQTTFPNQVTVRHLDQ